jgi:hypothetical protein
MKTLKTLLLVTVPTLIILVALLEIFFRTVVPATSTPPACFDEEEGLLRFCRNGGSGTATYGKWARQRAHWHINNEGWNSPVDYSREKTRPRIAVIGDSYVEALQVDVDLSYPSLLRQQIGNDYDVFSFGISGASLADYLNFSRYVARCFDPDIVVVNVVHNDFDESIYSLNPNDIHQTRLRIDGSEITEVAPRPNPEFAQFSARKRWLRKSALVRYLFFNLRIRHTITQLLDRRQYNANIDVEAVQRDLMTISRGVTYVVKHIRSENPERRVFFVMDAPRHDIYNERLAESNVMVLHGMLAGACADNGVELLDLTEPMAEEYRLRRRRFGFVFDGHWNEYGHAFVASQILPLIVENGDQTPRQEEM